MPKGFALSQDTFIGIIKSYIHGLGLKGLTTIDIDKTTVTKTETVRPTDTKRDWRPTVSRNTESHRACERNTQEDRQKELYTDKHRGRQTEE